MWKKREEDDESENNEKREKNRITWSWEKMTKKKEAEIWIENEGKMTINILFWCFSVSLMLQIFKQTIFFYFFIFFTFYFFMIFNT